MKKLLKIKIAIYAISIFLFITVGVFFNNQISQAQTDNSLANRLSGRILLEVESNGEAWYLNPNNNLRYYLGRPADAFNIMRSLGLGASNKDITNFLKSKAPSRLAGRILLQVEDKGQAYYVNPLDLKLHYLGRPADAFNVMRNLGLGITNSNLNKIAKHEGQANNNTETIPKENTEIKVITQKPALMINFTHIISLSASISKIDNIKEKGFLYDYTSDLNEELNPTLNDYEQKIIDSSNNTNSIKIDLSNLKPETYPHIRAYVIDSNNNIIYGNIETIDSVGKKGTPAMPISNSDSTAQAPNEEGEEGEGDVEPQLFTLTYKAPDRDASYSTTEGGYVKKGNFPLWEEVAPLAVARGYMGSAVINGKIYVVGGGDSLGNNNHFSVYNPETNIWDDSRKMMNIFREAPLTVNLNDKLYIIGGANEEWEMEKTAEVYDPETNTWEHIAEMTHERYNPVGGVYNGEIYVIGGADENWEPQNSIEIYNPETNSWRDGGAIPFNHVMEVSAQIVDDVIYLAGGVDIDWSNGNSFHSYDLKTETWTELLSMPEHRSAGKSFYKNGNIYYLGGSGGSSGKSEYIFEYNIENKEWKQNFNLPKKITGQVVEMVNDYLYVIGGYDDSSIPLNVNYKQNIFDFTDSFTDEISITVPFGADSEKVYAFFEPGYKFIGWSDGRTDNPRIDYNVNQNIEVQAIFERDIPDFSNPVDSLILEFEMSAGETLFLPVTERIFPYFSIGNAGHLNYFNFIVDWGDGSEPEVFTSSDGLEKSHTYSNTGTYHVSISGNFPYIDFFSVPDNKDDITSVIQWGDVIFTSFARSFYNCSNLSSLPEGPITGAENVTSFSFTFYENNLTSIPGILFDYTPLVSDFYNTFSYNSLTSIPAGLFDNNPLVTNFYNTFSYNSLISIPAGLFNNNQLVTDFRGTFNNNLLTLIPDGLFDENILAVNFNHTFAVNPLISIPADLFDRNALAIFFQQTFFRNSITSIPDGLFDNNPLVENFYGTFQENKLTSIPTGLFNNNPLVTDFQGTFSSNRLTSIPIGLFDNNPLVTSFHSTFNNNQLTLIPDGLFDNNPLVTDFQDTFSSNRLTSIPIGLFGNNPLVTSFRSTLARNSLVTVPLGLFTNNPNVTSFDSTFFFNSLTSIPAGLFANNPNATSFTGTFSDNSINSIPVELFSNNPNVTDFFGTFNTNSLTSIPAGLFNNNPNVTTFDRVFESNSTLTGPAPELWLRTNPVPTGARAFWGDTGLSNYANIPSNWK